MTRRSLCVTVININYIRCSVWREWVIHSEVNCFPAAVGGGVDIRVQGSLLLKAISDTVDL